MYIYYAILETHAPLLEHTMIITSIGATNAHIAPSLVDIQQL